MHDEGCGKRENLYVENGLILHKFICLICASAIQLIKVPGIVELYSEKLGDPGEKNDSVSHRDIEQLLRVIPQNIRLVLRGYTGCVNILVVS